MNIYYKYPVVFFLLLTNILILFHFISVDAKQNGRHPVLALLEEKRNVFEKINTMISDDFPDEKCLTLSKHQIFDWWESDLGVWNKNSENRVSISEVLSSVKMSDDRYQSYLSLFEEAGVKHGLHHCRNVKGRGDSIYTFTKYLMFSKRYMFGKFSCITNLVHKESGEIPRFNNVVSANDPWYVERNCI